MARKSSSKAASKPGQSTPNQRTHISRGEQGLRESEDGKLLEYSDSEHVLDPDSDLAVQVPEELKEVNRNTLERVREPTPEEVFESGDSEPVESSNDDDGQSSKNES